MGKFYLQCTRNYRNLELEIRIAVESARMGRIDFEELYVEIWESYSRNGGSLEAVSKRLCKKYEFDSGPVFLDPVDEQDSDIPHQ
jgi:hypothetical protein